MGRPGVLRKPDLPEGRHRDLNEALHRLHLLAGRPSLSVMSQKLRGAGISRSSIHDAFTSRRLPQWRVVDALIEILGAAAPTTTVEQQLSLLNELWLRAAEAEAGHPLDASDPQHANYVIGAFDIESFSAQSDVSQIRLRAMLYDFTNNAVTHAGVDDGERQWIDRGDSVIVLIEGLHFLAPVLASFLFNGEKNLTGMNTYRAVPERLRVRAAFGLGRVDAERIDVWAGTDLIAPLRLLDSESLRGDLRARPDDDLAVGIVYSPPIDRLLSAFPLPWRQVSVNTKEGRMQSLLADFEQMRRR